jgi:hypothetical protein
LIGRHIGGRGIRDFAAFKRHDHDYRRAGSSKGIGLHASPELVGALRRGAVYSHASGQRERERFPGAAFPRHADDKHH